MSSCSRTSETSSHSPSTHNTIHNKGQSSNLIPDPRPFDHETVATQSPASQTITQYGQMLSGQEHQRNSGHSFSHVQVHAGTTPSASSTPVSIQRSVWDGTDMENDFWGTKSLLGDRWGGAVDAGMSAAWNLAGAIPGVGTPISLAGSIIDSGKSLTSSAMGDRAAAEHFSNDSILSLAGAIPIWGTGQGVVGGLWDAASMVDRGLGNEPAPLSGDIFDQLLEY